MPTPTSTIHKDSACSCAIKAAIFVESKGLGVDVVEGFEVRGWTVVIGDGTGVEVALLSERRVTISWQSACMWPGLPHLKQMMSLRERSLGGGGFGHTLDMCPWP